jgi:hypothetical protein
MENTNQNTQPFLTLQIIHGALCLGVTLFLAVTLLLNGSKGHSDIQPNDSPLLYVAVLMAVIFPFISNLLYQKTFGGIDLSAPLSKKFPQYISACIMRYALIEGAALFNVVVWFLTHNFICAVVAAALVLYLISIRPVKNKVASLLQVSYPETLD